MFAPFSKARQMAKRHGLEYWRRHLEAWHQSDQTQKAYCASHGLSVESLRRWWRREKEALTRAKASMTLVPVSVAKPDTASVVRLRSPGGWEIELPGNSVPLLIDFLKDLS
jgi:transposase-like protein